MRISLDGRSIWFFLGLEYFFEKIGKAACRFAFGFLVIRFCTSLGFLMGSGFGCAGCLCMDATFRIHQLVIGFVDPFEPLLRLGIAAVEVGMVLLRQPSIGIANLLLACIRLN